MRKYVPDDSQAPCVRALFANLQDPQPPCFRIEQRKKCIKYKHGRINVEDFTLNIFFIISFILLNVPGYILMIYK